MSTKEKWIQAAKKELGGKDPMESLSRNWSEFQILPYYDHSDLRFNTKSPVRTSARPFAGPNGWLNLPLVDAASSTDANSLALDHLQNGADGFFLKINTKSVAEKLLNDIKPEFCFLGFEAQGEPIQFFEELTSIVPTSQLNGTIFWDRPTNWLSIANLFKGYNSFRCLGIPESGDRASDQIFNSLSEALKIVDSLTDYAFSALSLFSQLAFNVHASRDFLGDVIKIRSLRILISRLAQAYGLENAKSFIRVKIVSADLEGYQPHGEMILNSFGAIAAISSSADAITITSEGQQANLDNRTARNISLLLKEESRLDRVVDPFAGSYFIDSLTNAMVEKVWDKVKQL